MSETELVSEQTSPGKALAAARAELKLSVADVSQQIKFGVKQIVAIEADDYAKLPGMTFVRGMIRSYAKLVQLDPRPLLAGLDSHDVPAAVTIDLHTTEHEPFLEGGKKSNRVYVLLSTAAFVAVAAVAYQWHVSPPASGEAVTVAPKVVAKIEPVQAPPPASVTVQPGGDVPAADQGSPAPAPAAAVDSGVDGLKSIQLEFDQVSWVQIKQADGKVLLSQLNPANTRQLIEGVPPFELVIGNADHVRLTYEDEPIDLRPYFKVDVARLTLD